MSDVLKQKRRQKKKQKPQEPTRIISPLPIEPQEKSERCEFWNTCIFMESANPMCQDKVKSEMCEKKQGKKESVKKMVEKEKSN